MTRQTGKGLLTLGLLSLIVFLPSAHGYPPPKKSPSSGQDLGPVIIRGLIEGAMRAEQDRQNREGQDRRNDDSRRRRNPGNEQPYYPQNPPQYIPQPQPQPQAPQQPAAPPKYKPVAAGPYTIRPYLANHLAPPPVYPPASVRNQLMKELDAVIVSQIDIVDEVLKSADISDLAVRSLLSSAKKGAGEGLDTELLRDLQRASAEKDATKLEEMGVAMLLPDEPLEMAVLATFVGQLRKNVEDAVDPSDRRATLDVQKTVRKFQKKLRRAGLLDKAFRDGLHEKLEGVLAILDARQELHEFAAEARDHGSEKLEWPAGEVWVLASPASKSGSVFYITSDLIVAGTKVPGPISVMKSTIAAAVGCLTVELPPNAPEATAALSDPKMVTFINPPVNGRPFAFLLNGYDFEVKPGTMLQFTNSDDKKIETFRYAGTDGQKNLGFNLVDKESKLIKEAYYVLNWNGSGWSVSAERAPAFVSMSSRAATTSAMYLANDSNRTVTFKFNNADQSLTAGAGRHFDNVQNWRLDFAGAGGKKAYTLAAGKAFAFYSAEGGVDLKTTAAQTVTIDNSENAIPFTYALGDLWFTAEPFKKREHSFAVPPQGLSLTYDQGNSRLLTSPAGVGQTYTVAVTPGLQFTLATDRLTAVPSLETQREAALKREQQLLELAEKFAEQRIEKSRHPVVAKTNEEEGPVARVEPKPVPGANRLVGKTRRPSAHILSIGISKYANSSFNLKYADRDADEFAKAFSKAGAEFFQEISTEVLVNEKATKNSIEKALDQLTKTADDSDLVVMFFSAHGLSDDKRYYLCTHNVDPSELISTAVKYSDIVDAVQTLQGRDCRVLVLADTCNSGALGAGLGKKSLSDRTLFQAHKDYATAGSGCVLLASSADGQSSIERDEWMHGAFTKALLDTIADAETDQDGDGMLYLDEIVSSARRRLRKMTDGKQRLPVNWPSEIQDFPLLKAGL